MMKDAIDLARFQSQQEASSTEHVAIIQANAVFSFNGLTTMIEANAFVVVRWKFDAKELPGTFNDRFRKRSGCTLPV